MGKSKSTPPTDRRPSAAEVAAAQEALAREPWKAVTEEKIVGLIHRLDGARATVFLAQAALDAGETDLEIQAANALKPAFEAMDEVYDELVSLRIKVSRTLEATQS
ncbi:MAG TPA: hypothetical protein VMT29_01275 [Steroidobacteraceae bacterium]|nr:hypothetical protein [Steroidobacteraceae bacterium]